MLLLFWEIFLSNGKRINDSRESSVKEGDREKDVAKVLGKTHTGGIVVHLQHLGSRATGCLIYVFVTSCYRFPVFVYE